MLPSSSSFSACAFAVPDENFGSKGQSASDGRAFSEEFMPTLASMMQAPE